MSQWPGVAKFLATDSSPLPLRQKVGGRWAGLAVLAVLLVCLSAWFMAQRNRELPYDAEIAVLVSQGNSTTWPRMVHAFDAEACRHGWSFSESESASPGEIRVVFNDGGTVLFRLYKELGHGGLRQRVLSLCAQSKPPIAILSGSNSDSARVIAETLHEREVSGRKSPLYLLSSGTVDDLTAIHANKTFRFGHKNSRQAKEVVSRLSTLYKEQGRNPPVLRVAVVEIADNQFACEFSRLVEKEMKATFGEHNLQCTTIGLSTQAGTFDPTPEEREVTKKIALEMCDIPSQPWVIVLPASADLYRRFWLAHFEALQEIGVPWIGGRLDHLTFVAGDSIDFVDFANALKPENLHATAIFYGQYDPRRAGETSPSPDRLQEALYHEISETVLGTLADRESRQSPDSLRKALAAYHRPSDGSPYFDGAERHGGGGPVVVRTSLQEQAFAFDFPAEIK